MIYRLLPLCLFLLCLIGGLANAVENLVTLNVEPDKEPPRNSEGSFATLRSGRIIGKTWPLRKLIEDDPSGWYCYTAIQFTGDAVLLAYCAGESKIGGLNRLRIRRITLDWLPTD